MSLLSGRMNRRVFWVCYGCLVMASASISMLLGNKLVAGAVLFAPWIWMASKRLHDLNANWWWALAPDVVGFSEGIVRGWTRAADVRNGDVAGDAVAPAAHFPLAGIDWSDGAEYFLDFAHGFVTGAARGIASQASQNPLSFIVGTTLLLALLLWPGTRGANRFGETAPTKVVAEG